LSYLKSSNNKNNHRGGPILNGPEAKGAKVKIRIKTRLLAIFIIIKKKIKISLCP
jgi:hypothetical protein